MYRNGLLHADRLQLNINGWLPCASGISSSFLLADYSLKLNRPLLTSSVMQQELLISGSAPNCVWVIKPLSSCSIFLHTLIFTLVVLNIVVFSFQSVCVILCVTVEIPTFRCCVRKTSLIVAAMLQLDFFQHLFLQLWQILEKKCTNNKSFA